MRDVDSLSFFDLVLRVNSDSYNSRQIAVNGRSFSELLSAAYGDDDGGEAVSPLLGGPASLEELHFLQALIGAPPKERLRPGRIALGYCGVCFDSSCGIMAAAELDMTQSTVSWTSIGFEHEHFGEYVPLSRRLRSPFRQVIPPPEWWTPNPVSETFTFTFAREQYFSAVEAELTRLRAQE